jgi:hypothetical protein
MRWAVAFFQPLVFEVRSGRPGPPPGSSRSMRCWRVTGLAPTPCFCTGGGCRNWVSRFRCSTRTCAWRMVTRTPRSLLREMQSLGSTCCHAAVVADGTPPTASSSERAGDDRCLLTSGIPSLITNLRLFDGYTCKSEYGLPLELCSPF